MVSIFHLIRIRQTASWPSNRKVKKWTNTILNQTCSAAVYEREESITKSERNYILDKLLKDRGQRVADYGEVFLEFKNQMLENM